ncbi:uncharacterized protein LOC129779966 [Toxorhynchites rutilus septentrionalis]|uniref:uncharacterized protein LOC129779966 n=1 Tax=Toxorhynchites rutilus septentrionalis TaxID=329112 RepID=UPI00247A2EB7|nr:uncharacterized protein LOC129779966 [Toxorhynchites rutilus septentrionalis]
METLRTIIKIDTINKILEDIQEATMLSKISLASNKILSLIEINTIKSVLEEQGVTVDLPEEALRLVKPKIATSENTLLYITRIPQLEQEEGTVIRIIPLNQGGKIITNHPDFVIKLGKNVYTTSKPDEYIQQSSFLNRYTDICINPMLAGKKSQCKTIQTTKTEIQAISDNLILINNAKNGSLNSNCGPDNRTLTGNFLITFSNRSIQFENKSFTTRESTIQSTVVQGAMHNLLIDQQPEENDLHEVDSIALSNRKKIDHVYLKQYKNEIWNWSLLGGISLSTIITVTILVLALLHYKKLSTTILSRVSRKRRTRNPPSSNASNENA